MNKKHHFTALLYPIITGLLLAGLILIVFSGPLRRADLALLDAAFSWRGTRPVPENVVIIGLDENTFGSIDAPLALWNSRFALVLEQLAGAGASVIGFDLIQPRAFHSLAAENNQRLLEVVEQIQSTDSTKLVFTYLPDKQLFPFEELGMLLMEQNALAYANLTIDEDMIVRRQELFTFSGDSFYPSFPLAVCAGGLACQPEALVSQGRIDNTANNEVSALRTELINFYGPPGTFPVVSFISTLERAENADTSYFKNRFAGKIVLIGVVDGSDAASVAYSGGAEERVLMPGVEIHANTVSTILQGRTIRELKTSAFGGLPLIVAAMLLCLMFSRLPVGWGIGLAVSVTLSIAFTWHRLFLVDIYFHPAGPLALAGMAPLVMYSYRFIVEGREKRRMQRIFSSYVNKNVLEELISREDYTVFNMQKKPVALMFTDVRDFTTISESLDDPELLARLLNEYMFEMCKAIFEYNGTVNKFIGDGIMAMWGAPAADPRPCYHAVKAGLRMLEILDELNRRWQEHGYPRFKIGVGIHYDEVAVGYLGHPERMEYTALGDGVNVASRVEGLNKKLESCFLVTETVYEKTGDDFVFGKSAILPVKGRSDVKVFEVLDTKKEEK
jgi:adenylate cyclase